MKYTQAAPITCLTTICLALAAVEAQGQTAIDARTQTKNIDFSTAPSTKPTTVGTVLPATCSVGQIFFNSGAAAGANLYACTATNTWSLETGGGSGSGITSASSIGLASFVAPASGSGSAYVGSPSPCSSTLASGQVYWLKPDVANTVSNPTLSVCTFGAKTIVHRSGTGLGIGELSAGATAYPLIYDGTNFELAYEDVIAGPSSALTVTRTSAQTVVDINPAAVPQLSTANVWTGLNSNIPSPAQTISAATGTVLCNGNVVQVNPASSLTLTSTPTIASAGNDGTRCSILNTSGTSSLTLQDEAVLTSTNLLLGGVNITIGPKQNLTLIYNATIGKWVRELSSVAIPISSVTNCAAADLAVMASASSVNCTPGGGNAVTWSGTNLAVLGSIQPRWNQTGNSISCSGTSSLPVASSALVVLTGNCTLSAPSGNDGQFLNLLICEDSIGGRTLGWPSNFAGTMTITTTASKCNAQTFVYYAANSKWYALSAGVAGM